ncbi:MAG: ABC-type iron(III) transport system, permease component [candidate division TM6 bacterium GW2011_GWF2_30_66]|jgi:thiamine transport system permease protein|nr:MAG: ABC-type iron(III) transport system, permease component [candidate division TM6 bacterium GW2011_GWF2_30_66]
MNYEILIVFLFAFIQAIVSTGLSILLALPLAHFFYKFEFYGRKFFIALALIFCIIPTKLAAICISIFYGNSFAMGFTGIILAHLMLNIAFAFYIINLTYQKFDLTLLWLASEAGAKGWRCYIDIIFPLIKPTVISIFFLLFLLHFASFSIPIILGSSITHTTPEIYLYNCYFSGENLSVLIVWALRLLVILLVFFLNNKFYIKELSFSSSQSIVKREKLSLNNGLLYFIYCVFILIITVGPLIALILKACDKKVLAFILSVFSYSCDPVLGICVSRVILNSIVLAFASSIGTVFVAIFICFFELKLRTKIFKNIFGLITVLPFIIGSVGVGIIFSYLHYCKLFLVFFTGFLAHVFLNYAFAYRIIRAQVILYHKDLTKSAQALGASYKKAVITVAIPFVFPAFIRAFCMSFGLSLTEVGAGAILNGKIGLTIPMAIKIYRQAGCHEAVLGLSLILLSLAFLVTYFLSGIDENQKK